jgi:hypothetical protein
MAANPTCRRVHDTISAATAARRARTVREPELTPPEEIRESPQFKYPMPGEQEIRPNKPPD